MTTVTGTLVNADGSPMASSPFLLYSGVKNGTGRIIRRVTTSGSGTFSLDLDVGSYYIILATGDFIYFKVAVDGLIVQISDLIY